MPAVSVSPFGPKPQFVDTAGNPLVSGKLFFYVGGSTSTKQDTYTNSTGGVANTNPVILNVLGEPPNELWFTNGQLYKVVLAPSTDTDPPANPIWSIDNLQGQNSGGSSGSSGTEWILYPSNPTFISANSFSLVGNQTQIFHIGRRVQLTTTFGMVYGRITNSVFSSVTTITLQMDGSQVLDSSISAVYYSILSNNVLSLPARIATTIGTDTYSATVGTTRLVIGDEYELKFANANTTTSPTLNLDGLGVLPILSQTGSALTIGALSGELTIRYNGAAFIALNPITVIPSPSTSRQTVVSGLTDTNGYAAMLSAGTGLSLNLGTGAGSFPMRTAFSQGINDFISTLSTDTTSVVSALPANNISYITQDFLSLSSVTWGSTLAPVQYGYSYNQAAQSVLQFNGIAGSAIFLDDFGNSWTGQGSARIQTNQIKFGSSALGGGGASNAMNGTTDFIQSTGFTSLTNGSWGIRGWFYFNSFAAAPGLLGLSNAANYGIQLFSNVSSKTLLYLSSNGTSYDIANGTTGSATLPSATWTFIELTFDSVAAKYFLYVNGVLDQTISSSTPICPISIFTVGRAVVAGISTNFMNGYIDKFEFIPYCQHPNGATYAVPTAAPTITTTGYASDFFSIPYMTMSSVSGASVAAGINPTFTQKLRVYAAETTTGAATVSSVINYAYRGLYDSNLFPVTASQTYSRTHKMGCPYNIDVSMADATNGLNERTATNYFYNGSGFLGWYGSVSNRNISTISTGANVGISTSASGIFTSFFRIRTRRPF